MFGTKVLMRVLIGVAVLALLFGFLWLKQCSESRQRAAQNRVDQGQGEAFKGSASDAIETQGNVATNQQASEDLTRQNERNIRDAKGADQGVDPALRDAGFASLCRRQSFRNSPTGRLRCTPSGGVAPTR